jgi:hypothetical protein
MQEATMRIAFALILSLVSTATLGQYYRPYIDSLPYRQWKTLPYVWPTESFFKKLHKGCATFYRADELAACKARVTRLDILADLAKHRISDERLLKSAQKFVEARKANDDWSSEVAEMTTISQNINVRFPLASTFLWSIEEET